MDEDRPSLTMRSEELREELAAEIRLAFANVDRVGGVSWSETGVLDDYGSDAERLAARALDKDTNWEQVADDSEWKPDCGWGGWSFLDPIGFRYYLPAGMMRCLRSGHTEGLSRHLTLSEAWNFPTFNSDLAEQAASQNRMREYFLEQWSALDSVQRSCVKKFLLYMLEVSEQQGIGWGNDWDEALMSYWLDVE